MGTSPKEAGKGRGGVSRLRRRLEIAAIVGGYTIALAGPVASGIISVNEALNRERPLTSSSSTTPIRLIADHQEKPPQEPIPTKQLIIGFGTILAGYGISYLGARRGIREFRLSLKNSPL